MFDLTKVPVSDPTSIFRHRDALYASDMLIVALKGLDLFSKLAEKPMSLESLCDEFAIHERPADVLTTFLVASGWLVRTGEVFQTTEAANEFLVKGSPWYIGPYFPPTSDRPIANDLLECLRTDKPANFASRKNHDDWHKAMESDSFAREFTEMMDCRGVFLAQGLAKQVDLSDKRRLLDIAGGSGVYACSLCAHHAHLSATVLEKSPVDRIASQAIQERGYSDRVSTVVGDLFEDRWPGGFDVQLLSNVLHDWNEGAVKDILSRSWESLEERGLLIVHDTFLNQDKSGPLHVAEYSILLMHVTQGRCYSDREIIGWAQELGFTYENRVESGAMRSGLLFRR
ncbi:methyltransferase [Pirellulaceae bacterium SH449]